MTAERGFTLIEALIAFAILAIALVAFYETMGTGFRTFEKAADVEEAVLIAQSQLDRILALRRIPDERQGAVGAYRWRLDELPGESQDGALRLRHLRLSVALPGGGRELAIERMILVAAEPSP